MLNLPKVGVFIHFFANLLAHNSYPPDGFAGLISS